MTLLLVISGFMGAASSEAAPPDWWGTPQTIFIGTANDGAVASKGQVMYMARKAKEHLDLILGPVGGAGAEITQLFTDYAANNGIAVKNNQAIRIGQVKHIASKFWKRLQAVGAPDIPLQPAWPYHRNNRDIWTQSPNDDADTALATLGQVKSAFSFDIPGEAPLRARNFAWLWDGQAGATSGVLAGAQSLAYTNAPPQEGIPKTAVFKAGTGMSMTFLSDTTPPDPDAAAMVFTGILNTNQSLPYSSRPAWRAALFAADEPIEFAHFKGQGFDETRKVYPTLEYWGYVKLGILAADADLYYGTANLARFKGGKPATFIHHQQWVRDQPDADGVLFDYVRPFAGGYVTSGVLAGNTLLYITPTSSILCLARQPVKFVNFPSGTGGGSFAEGYVRRLTLAEDSTMAYGSESGAFRGNVTLKKNTGVTLVETDNSKGFAHVVNGVAKGAQSLLKSAFVGESVMDGEFLRFDPATGYLSSHSPAVTDNDLDNDLLPDEWEMKYGLDINFDEGSDGTHGDPDQDGVDNLQEFIHGTNPQKADTDGDSVSDRIEIERAADPLDATDGGTGIPSDQIVEVPFRVGDDSGSHSERWSMKIVGTDPLRDKRKFDFANKEFGTVTEPTKFKLRKGASYKITLTHQGTNDEAEVPDYDWLAEVDGQPASAPNAPGASAFPAAGHWIVDNSKALLGRLPDDQGNETADKTKNREAFLLPVEVRDIKDHANTGDDVTITNWNTAQQIADNNIAWIDAHSSTSDAAPRMPQLELRIPGLGQGMTIEAKLEVQYDRGNGQRTARNQPEDRVRIPDNGSYQAVTGDTWRVWESYATQPFFGGEATLTYRLMNGQNQAMAPQTVRFRIGGKNPDAARAKTHIETLNNAGPQGPLWFAYAIAKSESKDYNGTGTRYNQFWQLPRDANDTAYRATRQTHAGRPVFGNDPTGPGGYGMFQVTGTAADSTANIPRQQIWNWQENAQAALTILESKRTDADNWMTQQKNANNANGVALPSLTVRNVTFAEGTNRTMNHAVTIKAWNGAGRPASGFTDPEPVPAVFIVDPHGSGHFCYWKNSASGANKWALNRYNAFNPTFNYVDRVCQEVE